MVQVNNQNNLDNITEDEATLYDRQIRLWGLDAQKRLRKTQLLVVGLKGVSGETIKNIVLAGIDSITLCDSEIASEEDLANFLIPQSSYGKNRAEAAIHRTQDLNPTVKVNADTRSVEQVDEDFLKKFTVVLITNTDLREQIRINRLCHKNQIKFYSGQVWGKVGYYFSDLNVHQYVIEKTVEPQKTPSKGLKRSVSGQIKGNNNVSISLDDDEPSTSAQNNSNSIADDDLEEVVEDIQPEQEGKIFERKTLKYPLLIDAINVDLSEPSYQTKLRRNKFEPTFFAILALSRFRIEYGRDPSKKTEEADFAGLLAIRDEIIKLYKIDEKHFPKNLLLPVFGEVSPVCAVIGGVLAQDIIFAISGTEETTHNFFLFNPTQRSGHIMYVGPKDVN